MPFELPDTSSSFPQHGHYRKRFHLIFSEQGRKRMEKKISQCCFWPPDTENRILYTLCNLGYLYEQTRPTVHGPTDAFFLNYSKLVNEWRNNNKFRQDWWKTKIINKHTLTGDWIWNFFISPTNVNMLSEIVNDEYFEVWIAHNDNAGWYLIVIVWSFIYTLP